MLRANLRCKRRSGQRWQQQGMTLTAWTACRAFLHGRTLPRYAALGGQATPCERTLQRSNAVNSRMFLCRHLLQGYRHLEAAISVAAQAAGQLAPPPGGSHLYRTPWQGSGSRKACCCDGGHSRQAQSTAPCSASSAGAFLTPRAGPPCQQCSCRAFCQAPHQASFERRAGIPSQLTCQVQLQRARSSSADQSQFGHHHIWSIGI